jgi:hypothetical protein
MQNCWQPGTSYALRCLPKYSSAPESSYFINRPFPTACVLLCMYLPTQRNPVTCLMYRLLGRCQGTLTRRYHRDLTYCESLPSRGNDNVCKVPISTAVGKSVEAIWVFGLEQWGEERNILKPTSYKGTHLKYWIWNRSIYVIWYLRGR